MIARPDAVAAFADAMRAAGIEPPSSIEAVGDWRNGGATGRWWRAFYAKQVASAERDHGLPRDEAEARAFNCCVIEWLIRRPERSVTPRCPACGGDDLFGKPLLPFGAVGGAAAWLHSACWPAWHEGRKARAVVMLRAMGIKRRGRAA